VLKLILGIDYLYITLYDWQGDYMFWIVLIDEWYESWYNWGLGFMMGLGMKMHDFVYE